MVKDILKGYKNRQVEIQISEYHSPSLIVFYPGAKSIPDEPLFYWLKDILDINETSYIYFNFLWDQLRRTLTDVELDFMEIVEEEIKLSFRYLRQFKHKNITIVSRSTGCRANCIIHNGFLSNQFLINKLFWVDPHTSIKYVDSLNYKKDYVYIGRNCKKFTSDFVFMLNKNTTLRETSSLNHLLSRKHLVKNDVSCYQALRQFKSDLLDL